MYSYQTFLAFCGWFLYLVNCLLCSAEALWYHKAYLLIALVSWGILKSSSECPCLFLKVFPPSFCYHWVLGCTLKCLIKFRACFDCQREIKTVYLPSECGDPVFLAPFVEEATFSPIHCQNQVTALALMVHAFSPNIHRTQAGLRPAWLKLQVPGQSRMHSKAMSDKKNIRQL